MDTKSKWLRLHYPTVGDWGVGWGGGGGGVETGGVLTDNLPERGGGGVWGGAGGGGGCTRYRDIWYQLLLSLPDHSTSKRPSITGPKIVRPTSKPCLTKPQVEVRPTPPSAYSIY